MGGHQSSVSTALRNGCAGTGTQASICLIWEEWIDENIHITHTQRYTQKHQVYFFQGTWIYGSWDPLAVNMYNLSAEQKASQWGASQQCGGVIVWWRAHVHMNGCMFACVCVCVCVCAWVWNLTCARVWTSLFSVSLTLLQGLLWPPEAELPLWGRKNCEGPIKCAGHRSRQPNICDLCINQTGKLSRKRVRNNIPTLLPSPRRRQRWS